MTVWSYDDAGKSDLQLVILLMTIAESSWSRHQHLGAWQPVCIMMVAMFWFMWSPLETFPAKLMGEAELIY